MNILLAPFVFLLASYLSFINGIANYVELALPLETTTDSIAVEEIENKEESNLTKIQPTLTKGGSIPQILIDNASYQGAAVVESIEPEQATATAVDALVNIYCTYKTEDYIRVTTGTGFFIDTDGIILTNAHVAQFLLLDGIIGETDCVIRNGSPATPEFMAELLYISPTWIRENASLLIEETPKGTGERDYALLYLTERIDGSPLPEILPALPFDTELLRTSLKGQNVYVAGYPADSLMSQGAEAKLIPKLATTTVTELMTFGSNYADLFSISGSDVGERGSSGGPIVTENGDTIGLVSTRGDDSSFGTGSLRAITLSYIDRTIQEETGFSLLENISGDIAYRARIFGETMVPFLRLLVEQGI